MNKNTRKSCGANDDKLDMSKTKNWMKIATKQCDVPSFSVGNFVFVM